MFSLELIFESYNFNAVFLHNYIATVMKMELFANNQRIIKGGTRIKGVFRIYNVVFVLFNTKPWNQSMYFRQSGFTTY